jgi:hypothetical protein
MARITVLLARGIGIFIVVVIAAFMLRGMPLVTAAITDGPALLTYAIISLAMGVAMVVCHNVWTGGPLPVVLTLLGWLILLKGLLLLLLPAETLSRAIGQLHYGDHFYLYLAPSLVIGLYLTWAGFMAPLRDR